MQTKRTGLQLKTAVKFYVYSISRERNKRSAFFFPFVTRSLHKVLAAALVAGITSRALCCGF